MLRGIGNAFIKNHIYPLSMKLSKELEFRLTLDDESTEKYSEHIIFLETEKNYITVEVLRKDLLSGLYDAYYRFSLNLTTEEIYYRSINSIEVSRFLGHAGGINRILWDDRINKNRLKENE